MTILDILAADARARVDADSASVSLAQMRAQARDLPTLIGHPFERAVGAPGLSFICEVKKASPSRGVISSDYPYLDIAVDYEVGGAAAISVLTEPGHFLGSDSHLRAIADRVTVPVLRKDFTVDEYQIYQARTLGASAVLLICSLLSDTQLSEYMELAQSLGMCVLTETHDEADIERALTAGARIIGVNTRNLHDFSVDPTTGTSMRHLVPADRLFVWESGVRSHEDIADVVRAGADAVLMGEALMKVPNRAALLQKLRRTARHVQIEDRHTSSDAPDVPPVRGTRGPGVKICGITRHEDAEALNQSLPQYAGFVFHPASRRHVDLETALDLRSLLDPRILTVGVFQDAPVADVVEAVEASAVSMAQLHGAADGEYVLALRAAAPHTPIIKAVAALDAGSIVDAAGVGADYLLVDSASPGSGEGFDWAWLEEARLLTDLPPIFLAGGLTPDTVGEACRLGVHAVDVSSGVESDGLKDPAKIAAFIAAARGETRQERKPSPGRFGVHGGQYVPETLMHAVHALDEAYTHYKDDPDFRADLDTLLREYAGRPSLLSLAANMTADLGGAKVYLKREDLNHTGSHKINNVLGQCLLALRMGKTRVIAETGAGQHGVATATAAALLGLQCEIFMGLEDTRRQALNVYRMELLGATVHPVTSGTQTLKDAVNETMREWTTRPDDTHYVLGSVMGPHPFPTMVRDFQCVIGREARAQILAAEGKLPAAVVACVGGGSNAIGIFHPFLADESVALIGCEAAGLGADTPRTAATLTTGSLGIFHGMKSYFCQDEVGQIAPVYSISAGLDYPGVGPEHAWLHDTGRATYVPVTDAEAVDAFEYLARTEGIICAIESAHALAHARRIVPAMSPDDSVIVCLSGRGDKDVAAIAAYRGRQVEED